MSIACLERRDRRPGFYPLLAVMLLSLAALPTTTNSLEFFFIWELITLSSYFLILRRREAAVHALRYLLFSLVAAFFLLVGFALMHADYRQHLTRGIACDRSRECARSSCCWRSDF